MAFRLVGAKPLSEPEILLIGPLGTNFSEILIEILAFSFKKMCLKLSSAKWRPFCLGLNVLNWSRNCHVTRQISFSLTILTHPVRGKMSDVFKFISLYESWYFYSYFTEISFQGSSLNLHFLLTFKMVYVRCCWWILKRTDLVGVLFVLLLLFLLFLACFSRFQIYSYSHQICDERDMWYSWKDTNWFQVVGQWQNTSNQLQ